MRSGSLVSQMASIWTATPQQLNTELPVTLQHSTVLTKHHHAKVNYYGTAVKSVQVCVFFTFWKVEIKDIDFISDD